MTSSPEQCDLNNGLRNGADDGDDQPHDMKNQDSNVGTKSTVGHGRDHFPDEHTDENPKDGADEDSDVDDDSDEDVSAEILNDCYQELQEKYDNLRKEKEEQNDRFRGRLEEVKIRLAKRNARIAQLERSLAAREGRALPRIAWKDLFRRYIRREANHSGGMITWNDVYRASCRHGNMSQKPDVHHPDISFTSAPQPTQDANEGDEVPDVLNEEPLAHGMPRVTLREPQPFEFESLPIKIQSRIFRLLLVKGNPIHVLSRFDSKTPTEAQGRIEFPRKFWWKRSPCCISTAEDPNDILRILLVCKRWLYVGVGAFYGLNTFAFSSFGEMGRFFAGIGKARCERVTSIELLWQGSVMPRHKTRVNQRTKPLLYLTRLKNLQTLLVFIAENPEKRMRRRYDMQNKAHYSQDYTESDVWTLDTFQSMMKQTSTHPNFRGYRSMRTTHGMDYVYQLRGMTWVRFREVSKNRVAIRDWSFASDIATQVTMPKSQEAKREAEIENLADLCGEWDPSDLTVELVKSFYQPSNLDFVVGGSETSESDVCSISSGSSSDNSYESSPSPDPSEGPDSGNPRDMFPDEMDYDSGVEDVDMDVPVFKDDEDSDDRRSRDKFPNELDEIQSSSRGVSPRNRFPDEMDLDSGVEDVDMDVPVFRNNGDSNEDISESSQSDSDGFDGDEEPDGTQNHTTQSTLVRPIDDDDRSIGQSTSLFVRSNGGDIDDDDHSVGQSTSLFVRSNRDDADDDGNRVAESRRPPRSGAESSRDGMPPRRVVIDLTLDDDDGSTDQGQKSTTNEWDVESLFVHSKSGGSSDKSMAPYVIDLTGDDSDNQSNGRDNSNENKVKVEPLKRESEDPSVSCRGHLEHLKRQRDTDAASEPLQKRSRLKMPSPSASI